MKKSLLFSAVLAGLMLGSCSSSDDLAGGNTPANQDGNGYVAFTINLPSQSGSSSRAQRWHGKRVFCTGRYSYFVQWWCY